MTQRRRKRCLHCGLLETKSNGHHRGYKRHYCKNCDSYFTDRREHISDKNMFIRFERWILGKQSIAQLSEQSSYSERTLKRYFYKRLPTSPQWQIQRREKVNLLIDGTYFTNKVCLILYRDSNIKMTILYRLTKSEALRDLKEDLQNIKKVGIQIESVTCDGAANILRAVREVCPGGCCPAMYISYRPRNTDLAYEETQERCSAGDAGYCQVFEQSRNK